VVVDWLVFIPLTVLGFWNMFWLRNTVVLVLISVPAFFYKPFMEAFCGATVGKMAVGIKVADAEGKKLSLFNAYIRAFPFLMHAGVGLAGQLALFSMPQFQAGASWVEISEAKSLTFLDVVGWIVGAFVLIDCVMAAYTFRKRALHDMLGESYCVYKEVEVRETREDRDDTPGAEEDRQ
jgi:uncharacterized RDD family membrane protein YckC